MFNIGDKLYKSNYTQGAIWCNENNAMIDVIDGEYVIVAIPEKPPADSWFGSKNRLVETAIIAVPTISCTAWTIKYLNLTISLFVLNFINTSRFPMQVFASLYSSKKSLYVNSSGLTTIIDDDEGLIGYFALI